MISKLTLVALMSLVVVVFSQNETTVSVPPTPGNATYSTEKGPTEIPSEPSRVPQEHPVQPGSPSREQAQEQERIRDQETHNDKDEPRDTAAPAADPNQENSQDLARLAYGAFGLFFIHLL